MISVRCPECGSRLEVDDEHLGQDVRCPACRVVFPARPGGVPDARPARRDPDDDDERPRRRRTREDVVEDARRAVHLPALLSVIACVVTMGYHALDMAIILANPQMLKNNPFLNAGGGGFQWTPEMYAAARVFSILWQVVTLAGSFAMMRLKAKPFAVTAMVLQIVPCGAGICCILGLPLGIWGLIVLNRPDVKDGFELARDEGERRPAARDRDRGYDDEDDR